MHPAQCAQHGSEGIRPGPNRGSPSTGHSPPSHGRSSTAASSEKHKPAQFSKGLYFTGQSSSKLQQRQTLAPWEAATQPSGLRSGQPGYGSPDPLAGATKMRAHRGAGCRAPPQRCRRPGDMGALHGALHGRCWREGRRCCCQAGRPCGCSAALHAPLRGGSSHDWHEKPGQRAPGATLRGLTFLVMLWPCTGSICTASSARLSVLGAWFHTI